MDGNNFDMEKFMSEFKDMKKQVATLTQKVKEGDEKCTDRCTNMKLDFEKAKQSWEEEREKYREEINKLVAKNNELQKHVNDLKENETKDLEMFFDELEKHANIREFKKKNPRAMKKVADEYIKEHPEILKKGWSTWQIAVAVLLAVIATGTVFFVAPYCMAAVGAAAGWKACAAAAAAAAL